MVSKQPPRPHPGGQGNQQDRNALLQVHLAEYQAITTRNTYWLTLQYALFPILGAAVAVLAQMWNQFGNDPSFGSLPHRIIIWLVIAFANVIMIAHTEVGWESYDNVVYLERKLRPKIISLTEGADEDSEEAPLGYETYKGNLRGKGPKFWEVPAPIVSVGLLIAVLFLFCAVYHWTWTDVGAATINAGLSYRLTQVTLKMIRRRQAIGRAERVPGA
ncbi:MAG: hypothetical protein ACJ76N_29515 [Thermoanaerobaculia bacterium]